MQVDELDQLLDPLADLAAALAADLEAEGDVVVHRHVLERGVVLEDEADVAVLHAYARGVLARDQDPPCVGLLEPGDHAQQGRLSRAAGTEEGRQAAVGHVDGDVAERDEVPEALGHVVDDDPPARLLGGGGDVDRAIGCVGHGQTSLAGWATTCRLGCSPSSPVGRATAQEVHRKQDEDGQHRKQDRSCVGAGDVEVVVLVLDEERQRLGLARDPARDDGDRAELAERARARQHDAVGHAPADRRQGHPPEGLPSVGPERRGGLLLVVADLLQHGDHLAHHERQRDEDRRQDQAGRGEDDLDSGVVERTAEEAVLAVDEEERQADDHGRDRERQVDHRVDDRLARELVPDEHQRAQDPEDRCSAAPRSRRRRGSGRRHAGPPRW